MKEKKRERKRKREREKVFEIFYTGYLLSIKNVAKKRDLRKIV